MTAQAQHVNRREFIAGFGSTVMLPHASLAQTAIPVIGYLHSGAPEPYSKRAAAFHKGLTDTGLVEGTHFTIEYRWARGDYARLPEMARELVQRNVAVIFAGGGIASAPIAKNATDTIPIVFAIGNDPVAAGLVKSLARPEANVTGVSFLTQALGAKRLGFLNVLAPNTTDVAVLVNPDNRSGTDDVRAAARSTKQTLHILEARNPREIDIAFEAMQRLPVGAIITHSDPFFTSRLDQIAARGTQTKKPTIYPSRDYAEAGGLLSYGADVRDEYRKAGEYVAKLLRGAKPADLPITQPTKFELILNLKTAKAIGLTVPDSFQLLADEVIE